MIIFLGILVCLIVLMVVVFFHELGHFVSAKLCGVKVHEFGIGIPPKVATLWTDKSGTAYTLNALPIGGFVRLKGEEKPEEMNDADSIVNKSIPKQILIVLAGVVMNFLFAAVIFSVLFMIGVGPIAINQQIETKSTTRLIVTEQQGIDIGFLTEHGIGVDPVKGSIAEQAGLQKDDKIISINNISIATPQQFINIISSATGALSVTVERNNAKLASQISPKG
jgi:regulator of sigma E protease